MSIDNIGKITNKVEIGRRSFEDPKWIACKKEVAKRDKGLCQFQFCISLVEANQLVVGNQKQLDPAHVIAASDDAENIYNPKNVVTLQRYIHRRMDDYQNPLNCESITKNEHYYWWWRIITHKVEKYNDNVDYKEMVENFIRC